jgi:hypothetical protein
LKTRATHHTRVSNSNGTMSSPDQKTNGFLDMRSDMARAIDKIVAGTPNGASEEETVKEKLGSTSESPPKNTYKDDLLGDDLVAIRMRVLGQRPKESLTPEDHGKIYKKLQEKHQVDLNDEDAVVSLEDPNLQAHMEGARRRLAEHERAMLRLPRMENLRTKYLKNTGKLSGILRNLDDLKTAEKEHVEISFHHAKVIKTLLEGRGIHRNPSLPKSVLEHEEVRENLSLLRKCSKSIAKYYQDFVNSMEETRKALFVLRRDIVEVGDGLIEIVEAVEEDRRRLREYLMIASKVQRQKGLTEPPNKLGERLLTSKILPEKSGIKPSR